MNAMTKSRLEVIPLSKHIGAELRGLDLSKPLGEADVAAINKAWLDHIVILFRGQKLTQEDQLRLTGYFGEVGELGRPPKFFPPGFSTLLPRVMMM